MTARQPRVFISYQRTDEAFARQIREHLAGHGVTTWMDQYDIPVGAYWPDEIDRGLGNSDIVVGLLSPDSVASRNVKNEWDWAIQNGKRLLLLQVKPCAIPHRYVSINYIDATGAQVSPALTALSHALGGAAPDSGPAQPTAEPLTAVAPQPSRQLPSQLTPLIGRERELAEVRHLLATHRLVTLTGAGGIGKTRLALAVADACLETFPDGVVFVDLAPIADPGLVGSTIASAIGVQPSASQPVQQTLIDYLADKHHLLVLDNFEQIVAAAPIVSELLAACPRLHCLATSRIRLRLRGEQEYPLEPLGLPDLATTSERLSQYAAVELFIQRAREVRPDFQVTNENAPAVAETCARLDGLPLAIELAAARAKLLAPQAMLARLSRPLALLTGGTRDAPGRQQTIRNTIAWSYELLSSDEQRLLRQLSVFGGGWTLEAAEAVCDPDVDIFEGLSALVDHGLVRHAEQPDGEIRYGMLETIREFGLEQLDVRQEGNEARRSHAAYFMELAERAAPHLQGQDASPWMALLETEQNNLRAALEWAIGQPEPETTLRIVIGVWRFWYWREILDEGRQWSERALRLPGSKELPALRGAALIAAGMLAWAKDDYATAHVHGTELLELAEHLGDRQSICYALNLLGLIAFNQEDYDTARSHFERCLAIAQDVGDTWRIGGTRLHLGNIAFREGDLTHARALLTESVTLLRNAGDEGNGAVALRYLGAVALRQGDVAAAREFLSEGLRIFRERRQQMGVPGTLELLAEVLILEGRIEQAALLFAAVQGNRERAGYGVPPPERVAYEQSLAELQARLDESRFAALWSEGDAMSLDEAISYALAIGSAQPTDA